MPLSRLRLMWEHLFAFAVFASLSLSGVGAATAAVPVPEDLARLEVEVVRVAATAGATVGVGILHLETGRQLYLNRYERFPMASVFKLPLAVTVLDLVDRGLLDLDAAMVLDAGDLRPGSGTLAQSFVDPRPVLLRELLEAMMIRSDNTATDLLWKAAGGSQRVMEQLAALGIRGISVDRPTGLLLPAAAGLRSLAPDADQTPAAFDRRLRDQPRDRRSAARAAFLNDHRDTATPESMVALLAKVWRSEALAPERTAHLLDLLYRCETGRRRIRGALPRGTRVAHKTGTLRPSVVNDVGIVALPGRAGHLVLAVMLKGSVQDLAVQERVIATVSRVVYDHFGASLQPARSR